MVGEWFWEHPPSAEILALLGAELDDYADLSGTVEAIMASGWLPLQLGSASTTARSSRVAPRNTRRLPRSVDRGPRARGGNAVGWVIGATGGPPQAALVPPVGDWAAVSWSGSPGKP